MKTVFGLGNPGQQYKNNRHNVGFKALDNLAKAEGIKFKRSFKTGAYIAKKKIGKEEVLFVKPLTFMNNSGLCVRKILQKYKISADDVLMVYDDADLPLGAIRFRPRGSSAGHRGMASIIEALNTEEINRLKIGINSLQTRSRELADYVLSDFLDSEGDIVQEAIRKASYACKDWINKGVDFVMKNYNRRGGPE